jgi:hypothetical protein
MSISLTTQHTDASNKVCKQLLPTLFFLDLQKQLTTQSTTNSTKACFYTHSYRANTKLHTLPSTYNSIFFYSLYCI